MNKRLGNDPLNWINNSLATNEDNKPKEAKRVGETKGAAEKVEKPKKSAAVAKTTTTKANTTATEKTAPNSSAEKEQYKSKLFLIKESHNEYLRDLNYETRKSYKELLEEIIDFYIENNS